jgi:hypothetical protein
MLSDGPWGLSGRGCSRLNRPGPQRDQPPGASPGWPAPAAAAPTADPCVAAPGRPNRHHAFAAADAGYHSPARNNHRRHDPCAQPMQPGCRRSFIGSPTGSNLDRGRLRASSPCLPVWFTCRRRSSGPGNGTGKHLTHYSPDVRRYRQTPLFWYARCRQESALAACFPFVAAVSSKILVNGALPSSADDKLGFGRHLCRARSFFLRGIPRVNAILDQPVGDGAPAERAPAWTAVLRPLRRPVRAASSVPWAPCSPEARGGAEVRSSGRASLAQRAPSRSPSASAAPSSASLGPMVSPAGRSVRVHPRVSSVTQIRLARHRSVAPAAHPRSASSDPATGSWSRHRNDRPATALEQEH